MQVLQQGFLSAFPLRAATFLLLTTAIIPASAQTTATHPLIPANPPMVPLAVIVRHAPVLNGDGRIEGSLQQLFGENVTINGGFQLIGDLLVPGSPTLRRSGQPNIESIIPGDGPVSPANYRITLNGNCSIQHLRTRMEPIPLPVVPAPPQPRGTRDVTLTRPGPLPIHPNALRNLTLNGNTGLVPIPPGTYGTFTANGDNGFILGHSDGTEPAIYNLQKLKLNGRSRLDVRGPVMLLVANGFCANGRIGAANQPAWLDLQIASDGLTLNGNCTVCGSITAPNGTVILNGNSSIVGLVQCNRLIVNCGGIIRAGQPPNAPPSARSQTISLPQDTPAEILLAGSDPEDAPLTYFLLSPPEHGALTPQAANLNAFIYRPDPGYYGPDQLTFKVNDGALDSAPATISIIVEPEHGDYAVCAGLDQLIQLPADSVLAGSINISTLIPGADTNLLWLRLDGPGEVEFEDPASLTTAARFSTPGTYELKLMARYGGGLRSDTLFVDVLPPVSDRVTAARSHRGRDFWIMFLPNLGIPGEVAYIGCDLIIAAETNTVGRVEYSKSDNPREILFELQAGTATNLTLWTYPPGGWPPSDSIRPNSIHVVTDQPVTVHGLNYEEQSADGFLALPTSMLGTNYMVLAYRNSTAWYDTETVLGGTEFGIVASQSETKVGITPAANAGERIADQPFEIMLQRGETYLLANHEEADADLTGTTIVSDKPIAVFAGHCGALVPPLTAAADHLVEQLPPINQWGQQFVTAPLASRLNGDTFRLLANANATRLAINGKHVVTLNRGQFHETVLDCPAQILSSQPILVAQYANSADFDGTTGDPFMTLIPPIDQFGGDYLLVTAPPIRNWWAEEYFCYSNYVNLVVRTNGIGLITMDGAPVSAEHFTLLTNSGYATTQLPLETGLHHFAAPVPFGVCVYGWEWFESYAFMGGTYCDSLEAGTLLQLDQPTPCAALGCDKVVTARVLDSRGRPLGDVAVEFSVSGANAATGRVATSKFGIAQFAYAGPFPGTDVISARAGDLCESITNTWLAENHNAPPIVSASSTSTQQFGLAAQLAGSASDDGNPGGSEFAVRWTLLDGPDEAQIDTPELAATTALCSRPGQYQFEFCADDSQFSSRALVNIDVVRPFNVELFGPEPGAWFATDCTLACWVYIDILDGDWVDVSFYDGDVKLAGGLSTDLLLESLLPGPHSITAVVTEEHGFTVRSEPLQFFVTTPPIIEPVLPNVDLTLPYGESITRFQVSASDPDGSVTNLAVYVGPMLVHQVPGDHMDFTGPADTGEVFYDKYNAQQVRFVAADDHGITAETNTVLLTLRAPQITVELVSPAEDQVFIAGQRVRFVAEAFATPPAQISSVGFFRRAWNQWGSPYWDWLTWPADETAPFAFEWLPPGPGTYEFAAVASTDVLTSLWTPARRIIVVPPPVPRITLNTIPENRTNGLAGFPILIAADIALSNAVQMASVEFFADGQSLGALTNPPFLMPFIPTNPGIHTLTARATTEFNTAADSPPLTMHCGLQLDLLWESVRDGQWTPVGTNQTLSIRLVDPGSIFDHLEFIANNNVLASTRFTFLDWTPTAPGDYSICARAYDRFGNTYISDFITLHAAVLRPPEVRFLSPSPNAQFTPGERVRFLVAATGPDSLITNLALYRYSVSEVSVASGTLDYAWPPLAPGYHEFTATATDDKNLTGQATLRIVVDAPVSANLSPPSGLAPAALGCNAVRLIWDTNSVANTNFVLIERTEDTTGAPWQIIGKIPAHLGIFDNLFLRPKTTYHYRLSVQTPDGLRSIASQTASARTRAYAPGVAVFDLAENLKAELLTQSAGGGGYSPDQLQRTPSMAPARDAAIQAVELDALFPLGISDLHSVLLAGGSTNYIWSPESGYYAVPDTNFFPYRMTRPGWAAGSRAFDVPTGTSEIVTQFHAGFWADAFMDWTPNPQALRLPMTLPPPAVPYPYPTVNFIQDANTNGNAVGVASWVWVASYDGHSSKIWLGPFHQATLWSGPDHTPTHFGSLQQVGNESSFHALNDLGDIIGTSAFYDPTNPRGDTTHAVRSHADLAHAFGDKLTDIGTLGGCYSAAFAINNDAVAVGYSTTLPEDAVTNCRAVYWLPQDVAPRRLPAFDLNLYSYAHSINDRNCIVGEAADLNDIQQAVLWKPHWDGSGDLQFDLINLNDMARSPSWQLCSAQSINSSGLIVGSGFHLVDVVLEDGSHLLTPAPRAFLLLPETAIAVDYNRDGRIELNEADDLPDKQALQLWVNDDTDNGGWAEMLWPRDLPGAASGLFELDLRDPDCADDKVNGCADLIDWFPVYLNISNLLVMFPPPAYEYHLVHAQGALNFLYTHLRPNEAGSYQTTDLRSGFGPEFDQPAAEATGVERITPEGVPLSQSFLNQTATAGRGILLIEARHPTFQPLRLEVRKNGALFTTLELPLRISGAEDMYGWVNIRPVTGQLEERHTDLNPWNWPAYASQDKAFVFLHGYNVNERQSRAWAAEMFKRLWWSRSQRRFYAVSWQGAESQLAGRLTINFHVNVRHAFESAPSLAYFLTNLLAGCDVTVAAHSLGSMLLCSAIQDCGAQPDRSYFVNAAVALEAFDATLPPEPFMTHPDWHNYDQRLFASEWHRLFEDIDGRHGLTWRGRFQDVPRRTRLYNFYSSGEEVLENRHDDSDPWMLDVLSLQFQAPTTQLPVNWIIGRYAWILQELLKGRVTGSDMARIYAVGGSVGGIPAYLALRMADVRAGNLLGSQHGGWGFNSHWDTPGSFVTILSGSVPISLYLPGNHCPAEQSSAIPNSGLQLDPFFLPFLDPHLTSTEGDMRARNPLLKAQLLSEAIPARTFAAGANKFSRVFSSFNDRNQFDMNSQFQRPDQPECLTGSYPESKRWMHSDIRQMPYVCNGAVFDQWVNLGDW